MADPDGPEVRIEPIRSAGKRRPGLRCTWNRVPEGAQSSFQELGSYMCVKEY